MLGCICCRDRSCRLSIYNLWFWAKPAIPIQIPSFLISIAQPRLSYRISNCLARTDLFRLTSENALNNTFLFLPEYDSILPYISTAFHYCIPNIWNYYQCHFSAHVEKINQWFLLQSSDPMFWRTVVQGLQIHYY